MKILLGLAPFLVFALVTNFASPAISLGAAAIVSAALILKDRKPGKPIKVLEGGTFLLFIILSAYTAIGHVKWDISGVRSVVDSGLLAIVLISIIIKRPFTLQYAREQVTPEVYQSPAFIRVNYIISSIWASAFAAIVAADLALHYIAAFPAWLGTAIIILSLVTAVGFTAWYPKHLKSVKSF